MFIIRLIYVKTSGAQKTSTDIIELFLLTTMGNGALLSSPKASSDFTARYSIFINPKCIDTYRKFINEPSANESFTIFIKNGMWLSKISHNSAPHKINIRNDSNVDDGLSEAVQSTVDVVSNYFFNHSFITNTTKSFSRSFNSLKGSISISLPTTDQQLQTNDNGMKSIPNSDFYITNSMNTLEIYMILVLFPMYLISKDYQLWLKWKESLSKMMEFQRFINNDNESITNGSYEYDYFAVEEHSDTIDAKARNILYNAAALFDQSHLELSLQQRRGGIFTELYSTIENSIYGITICDAKAMKVGIPILYSNKTMELMTGYDLRGRDYDALRGKDTEVDKCRDLYKSFTSMQPVKMTLTSYRQSGVKFNHLFNSRPIFDANSRCMYVLTLHCDLTSPEFNPDDLKDVEDLLSIIPLLIQHSLMFDNIFTDAVVSTAQHQSVVTQA